MLEVGEVRDRGGEVTSLRFVRMGNGSDPESGRGPNESRGLKLDSLDSNLG